MDIITDERRLWRLIALFTTTMICSVAQGFYGQDYDDGQNYDELPIENITYNIHLNQIEIQTDLLIESGILLDAQLHWGNYTNNPIDDNHDDKIIIPYQNFNSLENAQNAYIKVKYSAYSFDLLGSLLDIFINSSFSTIFSAPIEKHKTFKIKNAVEALKDKMLKELGVASEHYATEIKNRDDYKTKQRRQLNPLFLFAAGESIVWSDIFVSQGIANHVLNIIAMKAATTPKGKIDTTLSEAFALLKITANPFLPVSKISDMMMNSSCTESKVTTLTSCEQLDDFLANDITKKLESFFKKAADVLHQNVILESNTKDPNHPSSSFGLAGATVSIEETPVMWIIHFFAEKYKGTSITLPKDLVSYSTKQVYTGFEEFHFTKTKSECGDWCIYTKKDGNQIEDADIYDAFYRLEDPYIVINRHVTCTEHRRLMQKNEDSEDMPNQIDCAKNETEDNQDELLTIHQASVMDPAPLQDIDGGEEDEAASHEKIEINQPRNPSGVLPPTEWEHDNKRLDSSAAIVFDEDVTVSMEFATEREQQIQPNDPTGPDPDAIYLSIAEDSTNVWPVSNRDERQAPAEEPSPPREQQIQPNDPTGPDPDAIYLSIAEDSTNVWPVSNRDERQALAEEPSPPESQCGKCVTDLARKCYRCVTGLARKCYNSLRECYRHPSGGTNKMPDGMLAEVQWGTKPNANAVDKNTLNDIQNTMPGSGASGTNGGAPIYQDIERSASYFIDKKDHPILNYRRGTVLSKCSNQTAGYREHRVGQNDLTNRFDEYDECLIQLDDTLTFQGPMNVEVAESNSFGGKNYYIMPTLEGETGRKIQLARGLGLEDESKKPVSTIKVNNNSETKYTVVASESDKPTSFPIILEEAPDIGKSEEKINVSDGDTLFIVENVENAEIDYLITLTKMDGSVSHFRSRQSAETGEEHYIELSFPDGYGLVDNTYELVSELEIDEYYTVKKVSSLRIPNHLTIIPKYND